MLLVCTAFALLSAGGGTAAGQDPAGRVLTLVSAKHPRRVTLEWRRIEGGGTVPVSEQQVTLGERTSIPAGFEERVLRVREPGAAPRSFFLPAGDATPSFELGPPAVGGEVFGRLPRRRFRPLAMRLVGGAGAVDVCPDDDGVFQASGLPPGPYRLVPVHRGGIAGREAPIVVRSGQTVDVLAPDLPETGAIRLDLVGSLCGETELSLQLQRLAGAPGRHASELAPGVCGLDAEGLEPGNWRATVTRGGTRNEPRAATGFQVVAGETVEVPLEAVVRVAGTVTAGGVPAAGLRLVFERAAARWNVVTDPRGAYEVLLGTPGEYEVSVLASGDLPSRSFTRTFGPGDQQEDVELGPGELEVSVRAEVPGRPVEGVELGLFEAGGRRLSGRIDTREESARFTGLQYGEYTVTGTTASGLRSRNVARARLSAESPTARVELLMGGGAGTLRVVGSAGAALEGARASAGGASLPARSPGVFDLAGVPAGERLVVHAPDHHPVCRILEPDAVSEVVVPLPVADGAFTLRLPGQAPWRETLLLDLAGSDCPLALDDLEPQVRSEDHQVTVVLRLPRGSFGIVLAGVVHPASAPGELDLP